MDPVLSAALVVGLWYLVKVKGLPGRRVQVRVCGAGRGLDRDAGFVLVADHHDPAHERIYLLLLINSNHSLVATRPTIRFPCFEQKTAFFLKSRIRSVALTRDSS